MPLKYKTDEERAAAVRASKLAYYHRNKEKHSKYGAEYRAKNKGKIADRMREYDKANVEKIKERKRLYRIATKAKRAEYLEATKTHRSKMCAGYYKRNAEEIKARVSAYGAANPELVLTYSRNKRARKRAAGGTMSKDIISRLMSLQKGKCACCKVDLNKAKAHLDHVVPLARGGSNTDDNAQLLCQSCNCSKSAKHPIEFMQSRGFLL